MGRLSRRALLLGLPPARVVRGAAKPVPLPPAVRRFTDPLTDREVWRLTPLANPHFLPDPQHRFTSEKNSFVLVSGRAGGATHAYRMELPSGRMLQLTQGADIHGRALCLAPDERSFFYLQNGSLKQMGFRTYREREIWRVEEGWRLTGDLSISIDGRYAAVIESREAACRLRLIETLKGRNWVAAEEKTRLSRPQLRPKRDQVLYTQADPPRLWLVNLDGKQRQAVRPRREGEEIGPEYWTTDGKLIGYTHYLNRKA